MASDYLWMTGGKRLRIEPNDKDFDKWDVGTIAHSLARIGRWCGHTEGSLAYSVAQHSVLVSYMTPEYKMEGLFHDAAEFALGDITTPIKMWLGEEAIKRYRELTHRWDHVIAKRFNLREGPDVHHNVKLADRLIQYYEGLHLVAVPPEELARFGTENPVFGPRWGDDPKHLLGSLPARVETMLDPLPANQASRAFLRRYKELKGEL
jgi:hypothetical protein